MKKALLLHGTDGSSQSNWLPWLKVELEAQGWTVWVPDLPQSDRPNIQRYNDFIFAHMPWEFDSDTYIVGHSSGAVEALGLLQAFTDDTVIAESILIGSFMDDLGWDSLSGLFEKPFEYDVIRARCRTFTFIHSDDDPYCPLPHAEYLSEKLNGELKVISGQKHFSTGTDPKYTTFPLLRDLLLSR